MKIILIKNISYALFAFLVYIEYLLLNDKTNPFEWYFYWVYFSINSALIVYFDLFSISRTFKGGLLRIFITSSFSYLLAFSPEILNHGDDIRYFLFILISAIIFINLKIINSLFRNSFNKENNVILISLKGLVTDLLEGEIKFRGEKIVCKYEITDKNEDLNELKLIINKQECASTVGYEYSHPVGTILKIYLYTKNQEHVFLNRIIKEFSPFPVDIVLVTALSKGNSEYYRVDSFGEFNCLILAESPLSKYPQKAFFKRMLDLIISFLAIIILIPLLILICYLIKKDSKGPVFFIQKRHGYKGKIINVYKFRSMYEDNNDNSQAKINDARVTPVGRFLRKYSLDELPQLFNVIRGDLSLVGPRPHPIRFKDEYSHYIYNYMYRHNIRPGITGLAQVSGARGETETVSKMQKRIDLDLRYINQWTLWLDFRILLKTPFVMSGNEVY